MISHGSCTVASKLVHPSHGSPGCDGVKEAHAREVALLGVLDARHNKILFAIVGAVDSSSANGSS